MITQLCKKIWVYNISPKVTQWPGGGTWVFFRWVCASRDSPLAPRSKKISSKIDTPF